MWVKSAHSSTVLRDVSRPQIWAANEDEKRRGGGRREAFSFDAPDAGKVRR